MWSACRLPGRCKSFGSCVLDIIDRRENVHRGGVHTMAPAKQKPAVGLMSALGKACDMWPGGSTPGASPACTHISASPLTGRVPASTLPSLSSCLFLICRMGMRQCPPRGCWEGSCSHTASKFTLGTQFSVININHMMLSSANSAKPSS